MVLQESISTALDSIRANLLRSLLTTIAIVIGTASVIAMVGIGSSAQRAIDDSITNLSARTLSVYPSRGRGSQKISAAPLSISDADALIKDEEILPGFASAIKVTALFKPIVNKSSTFSNLADLFSHLR